MNMSIIVFLSLSSSVGCSLANRSSSAQLQESSVMDPSPSGASRVPPVTDLSHGQEWEQHPKYAAGDDNQMSCQTESYNIALYREEVSPSQNIEFVSTNTSDNSAGQQRPCRSASKPPKKLMRGCSSNSSDSSGSHVSDTDSEC